MYNIKVYRVKLGMTQEELSAKSGVSRQIISNLEKNDNYVTTTQTLQKLAKALKTPVNKIFLP